MRHKFKNATFLRREGHRTLLLLAAMLLFTFARAQVITGPSQVCLGDEPSFLVSPASSGYTYSWSVTGALSSGQSNLPNYSAVFNTIGQATVSLNLSDANNNLISNLSYQVSVLPQPVPVVRAQSDFRCTEVLNDYLDGQAIEEDELDAECLQACGGEPIVYYTKPLAGSTYQWIVLGAQSYTASGNEVTVIWPSAAGQGTVKVIETNESFCVGEHEQCVTVIEAPTADFVAVPGTTVCLNQTVYFTDQSTDAIKWTWDFGNGETMSYNANDPNPIPQVTYANSGSYNVTLTVENACHCTSEYTQQITVTPNSAPVIECVGVACEGDQATYQCLTACTSYNWNVTNGTVVSSSGDMVVVEWTAGALGTLEVITTGCGNGCPNSLIYVPVIPNNTTISGKAIACYGTQERYWIPKMPGCTYTWSLTGSGSMASGQNTNELVVKWGSGSSGTVSVTYNNPVFSCGGTESMNVTLRNDFEFTGDDKMCLNDVETYTTNVGTSFSWEVQDDIGTVVYGPINGSNSHAITYNFGAGDYEVIARDLANTFCNSSFSFPVEVMEVPGLNLGDITGEQDICEGRTYDYAAVPTGNDYYIEWTTTNGTPTVLQGENVAIQWNVIGAGNHAVNVTQRSKTSPHCASPAVTYPVQDKGSVIASDFNLGDDIACETSAFVTSPADWYEWRISPADAGNIVSGQGSNSVVIKPNHEPGGPASFGMAVQLSVERCGVSSGFVSNTVTAHRPIVPELPLTVDACEGAPTTINIVNLSCYAGATGSFVWEYDGTSTTEPNGSLTYTFTEEGIYPLTVYYSNPNSGPGPDLPGFKPNCEALKTSVLVNVKPAPEVRISSPGRPCLNFQNPVVLHATVRNLGGNSGPYDYSWDPALTNSPDQSVTTFGLYQVTVTDQTSGCTAEAAPYFVHGSCGTSGGIGTSCNAGQGAFQIEDVGMNPIVETSNNGCGDVTFSSSSYTNIPPSLWVQAGYNSTPYWIIEDPAGNATGFGTSISHTFSTSGYHAVIAYDTVCWYDTLTNNPLNIDTLCCYDSTIHYVHIPLHADFYPEFACNGAGNLEITLIDNSDWTDFNAAGMTATFSATAPATFVSPGTYSIPPGATADYTITLIQNGNILCTATKTITAPDVGVALFTAQASACEGNSVPFTNTSTGPVVDFAWDFGDGAEDISESPVRTYAVTNGAASQNFNVQLTVTDAYGCTSTASNTVQVFDNTVSGAVSPGSYVGCQAQPVILSVTNNNPGTAFVDYAWTNGGTNSTISAIKSGDYGVAVTDVNGCKAHISPAYLTIYPKPKSQILGPDEICEGLDVEMNGYQGTSFTYLWTVSSGMATTALNQALLSSTTPPAAATYNFNLVTTETYSGQNCSDNAPQHSLVVKGSPSVPTISVSGSSPYCLGAPRTLTASSGSAGTFNWSNGDYLASGTASNILVNHWGEYSVTFTDAADCQSRNSIDLHADPDFSEFMSGCYEFCVDHPKDWPGIPGYFSGYKWYRDGAVVASGTSPSPGSGIQIPTLYIINPGQYELEVTTLNGCTDISPAADIYFTDCSNPCSFDVEPTTVICVGENKNGEEIYYIEMDFTNIQFPASVHFDPMGNGLVSNQNPLTLGQIDQAVGINYTNTSGNYNPCFDVIVTSTDPNISYSCTTEVCVELPTNCRPSACDLDDYDLIEIKCLTNRTNNYNDYSWSFNIYNPSGIAVEVLQIIDLTTSGTIGFNPSILPAASGSQMDVTFSTYRSPGSTVCLQLVARPVGGGDICVYTICEEIPDCRDVVRCEELDSRAISINCEGRDAAGNIMYELVLSADNQSGAAVPLVAITSTQGTITGYGNTLPAGNNTLTLSFTALPPYYDPVCFTIWIQNQAGELVPCDACIERLPCVSAQPVPRKKEDGETTATTAPEPAMQLYPNPARTATAVDYQFEGEAPVDVVVRDVFAREVTRYTNLPSTGNITLEMTDWASGTYFIFAIQQDIVVGNQILVKE